MLVAESVIRTATLDACGIFDITAPIAARIAALTLADTFDHSGTLAPAQVITDPRRFLDGLADHGLVYHPSVDVSGV